MASTIFFLMLETILPVLMNTTPESNREFKVKLIMFLGVFVSFCLSIFEVLHDNLSLIIFSFLGLLVFITHNMLAHITYRIRYFGIFFTAFLYTVVIDGFLYIFITNRFSPVMLFPFILIAFLLLSHNLIELLINYHLERSRTCEYKNTALFNRLMKMSLELKRGDRLNLVFVLAFVGSCVIGYTFQLSLVYLFTCFAELSVMGVVLISIYKLIKNCSFLTSIQVSDFPDEIARWLEKKPYDSYGKSNKFELVYPFNRPVCASEDEIIDYYDRASDIRQISYYNSIFLIITMCLYLSAYSLLPNTVVSLKSSDVALFCVGSTLIFAQIPFFLGQRHLLLLLSIQKTGEERRKIIRLLTNGVLLKAGEVVSLGIVGPILIWGLKVVAEWFI